MNITNGTIAAQCLDESVFVLSPECQCDWGNFAEVGATAGAHPIAGDAILQRVSVVLYISEEVIYVTLAAAQKCASAPCRCTTILVFVCSGFGCEVRNMRKKKMLRAALVSAKTNVSTWSFEFVFFECF